MKKIFNKKIMKKFCLKKSKGTTIVEVLVSVIIIGIVSMYGLSFFSSSYKFATDSRDYSFILQEMIRKMEIIKGATYERTNNPSEESNGDFESYSHYEGTIVKPKYITHTKRDYPNGITSSMSGNKSDRLHFNFKMSKTIRPGCTVMYDYKSYENSSDVHGAEKFYGSTKVELTAEWPTEYPKATRNEIKFVTYVADRWE